MLQLNPYRPLVIGNDTYYFRNITNLETKKTGVAIYSRDKEHMEDLYIGRHIHYTDPLEMSDLREYIEVYHLKTKS